jgi:exonuclease VII small subunit
MPDTSTPKPAAPKADLTFEKGLERLEKIVQELEPATCLSNARLNCSRKA